MLRIDGHGGNLLQPSGQPLCVLMVFLQSTDVMFQRIEPCCSENAGLAHRATVHPAEAPGPFHETEIVTEQQRAGRCAESFRQAERDGLKMLSVGRGRKSRGGRCIEESGSVQVYRYSLSRCH